jgi:hypothetical protein
MDSFIRITFTKFHVAGHDEASLPSLGNVFEAVSPGRTYFDVQATAIESCNPHSLNPGSEPSSLPLTWKLMTTLRPSARCLTCSSAHRLCMRAR